MGFGGHWTPAAIERTARASALWAKRAAEPPDWDPETQGRWANVIANRGPEEEARRVAYELERARRALWWQCTIELADARVTRLRWSTAR
jgi:hypothetical protein